MSWTRNRGHVVARAACSDDPIDSAAEWRSLACRLFPEAPMVHRCSMDDKGPNRESLVELAVDAAARDDVESLKLLQAKGCDLRGTDRHGHPLEAACRNGAVDAVAALLAAGVRPSARCWEVATPTVRALLGSEGPMPPADS